MCIFLLFLATFTEYTAALDAFLAENDEEDVASASSAANGKRLAIRYCCVTAVNRYR
jgi:hypothetical protein